MPQTPGTAKSVGLLAQVVASRGLQPEPVATDALNHLLGTSPAASDAFGNWIGALLAKPIGNLTFSTQVSAKDLKGRPDLIAADELGIRVVGEAKFDADLTKIQQGDTYLDRLKKGQPGLLLFVLPEDRLAALWPKIVTSVGAQEQLEETVRATSGTLSLPVGDARLLVAVSWKTFLELLQAGVDAGGESQAQGDLQQLRGLVDWRSRTGWVPLAPGDLPGNAGRQLRALRDCALKAAKTVSDKKLRNGTGDWGPGRYVKTKSGRSMYVGISLERWDRHGISPLWVSIHPRSDKSVASVKAALAPLQVAGGPGRFALGSKDIGIPLTVPPGAELDAVTESLVTQLQRIASLLDDAASDVVTEEPEDPAVPEGS